MDNADVGFVVVPPWVFYPDYEFDLDDATAEHLGLEVADDAIVLAVVTLRDRPDEATLNLLGPIVVNRHTHDAAQVVLPTTSYSVRRAARGRRLTATGRNPQLGRLVR